MSRNAAALKPSIQRKPERRLRSLAPPEGHAQESSPLGDRLQGLKDTALALLKEAQSLEHEILISELVTPKQVRRLDIENGIKLADAVRQFETNIIRQALLITGGNQARAARLLGVKANTLNYKVKLYNL
ncbi:MAG TPA: helix-turn-helix domain-containing protein [Pyrinomonadaceae bacterium]|nr:helix-turn-helix domain-containing protein [Pyrinomonadaceae bacterium]